MMPIASINIPTTVQTPVISTPLPDTAAQHVPYDNVPPSVSNAQVDNNARGNSTPPAPAEPPPTSPSELADEAFSSYLSSASTLNINAQATFLAQLIGQDITVPPETAGILVQYEKIAAYSNVKYKPSNAFRPEAAPANAFSNILGQPTAAKVAPTASVENVTVPVAAPTFTLAPVNDNVAPNPAIRAAGAYALSAARPGASSSQNIGDLA